MNLLLPVVAVVALWVWTTGRWRRIRWSDIAAVVAALLSLRLLTRGEWLPGLIGLGFAGGWLWYGHRDLPPFRRLRPATMTANEARGVLEVPARAHAATQPPAQSRLIVRVHPDAGGSAELARRVNGARDTLLAELNRSRPRAS